MNNDNDLKFASAGLNRQAGFAPAETEIHYLSREPLLKLLDFSSFWKKQLRKGPLV